ncbi:MAG TPA: hypothetical protein VIR00_02965 [Micromonosporaceae bacterium]
MGDNDKAVLKVRDSTESGADATETWAQKQERLNREQMTAVDVGEQLIDVWNTLHGAMKTEDEQMLDVLESLDKVKQSFEDNGNAIDGDSEAALRNRTAMEDMAQQAYEAADAIIANGGSAEEAQAKLDEWKTAMVNAAEAAGISKDAAQKLADELFRMPAAKQIDVNVNYVYSSQGMTYGGAPVVMGPNGGYAVNNRRGGAYVHAADGVLSSAGVFGEMNPARYAFAEPGTGGEAFVPRRGDYGRSMGILSTAAGWYGADVVPRGGYTSGATATSTPPVNIIVSAGSGLGGAVVGGLQFDVQHAGAGDVQNRYGRRGRN